LSRKFSALVQGQEKGGGYADGVLILRSGC